VYACIYLWLIYIKLAKGFVCSFSFPFHYIIAPFTIFSSSYCLFNSSLVVFLKVCACLFNWKLYKSTLFTYIVVGRAFDGTKVLCSKDLLLCLDSYHGISKIPSPDLGNFVTFPIYGTVRIHWGWLTATRLPISKSFSMSQLCLIADSQCIYRKE